MPHFILFILSISMIILGFILQRKHLLMTLLFLEGMILILVSLLVFSMGHLPYNNPFLFIVLLTFGACEASLGLSLLVSMTRSFGNDMMNSLTINKC